MNRTADVVVVGAGVIGLCVAWELCRRGARVRIVDARDPGQGATQASAGMLAPHVEAIDQETLWTLGSRSLDLYDGFVERLRTDSGVPIEYRRCGSLHVCTAETGLERLREVERRIAGAGIQVDFLDRALLHELEPQIDEQAPGGLFISSHGYVSAPDLVRALRAALDARGAKVASGRVLRVTEAGAGVCVDTASESVCAASAVIAAGSWTPRISVGTDQPVPVRPIRGQLLQTDWPAPPVAEIVWGPDCYLVPWTNGTLLVGATVEDAGFDERATVAGVRDLLDAACDLMPRAWQAAFTGVRVGLRPATPDGLPVLGRSPSVPGAYYATGHFRNGVLLTPLTAVLMADLVLGQREDPLLSDLRADRFFAARGQV